MIGNLKTKEKQKNEMKCDLMCKWDKLQSENDVDGHFSGGR